MESYIGVVTATAAQMPHLLAELNEATRLLRGAGDVPPEVTKIVRQLADELHADQPDHLGIDPYMASALFAAALRAMAALHDEDVHRQRRDLRIALEQLRHVVRDVSDSVPVGDDQPSKAVLAHLIEQLAVPQAEVADLLRISPRQLQRWLSPQGPAPEAGDAARVRVAAQVANHLRHTFTGPGVVQWFHRPHPGLGRPPRDLLDDPLQAPTLLGLALSARTQGS